MAPERVCTVQPLEVSQNALFIVDVNVVNFEDLKVDDLGSWKGQAQRECISEFRCQAQSDILRINLMQAYLPSIYN